MSTPSPTRRWPKRLAIGAAVVVVLAVGVPFAYIHLIEGTAPAKLSLPTASPGSGSSGASGSGASDSGASDSGATSGGVSGTWGVASGSIVGYRVSETLVGQKNTAVGRTSSVSGSLDIDGTTLRSATFTVRMGTVKSDESGRDAQFDGRIMDVDRYPTGTFTMTKAIDLGSIPAVGVIRSYSAAGNLTLHGETRPVAFTVNTERTGSEIEVQGDITVVFAHFGISNPSFGFVTTANDGTLEFLLRFARGASSLPASSTTTTPGSGYAGGGNGGPGGGFGGGGPGITVPATTVPPLKLGGS